MKNKLNISDLESSGLLRCLPENEFIDVLSSGSNYINIENDVLEAAKKELHHRNETGRILNEIAGLNNKGIEYEKSGMIEKAILEYEKCMKVMYESIENRIRTDFAWHSPNRLRILYKKEKHPREKEFLQEFVDFSRKYSISIPLEFERQLNGDNSKKNIKVINFSKSDIKTLCIDDYPISRQIEDHKSLMPEFDFYYKLPQGMPTSQYLMIAKPVPFDKSVKLRHLIDKLKSTIANIKESESDGNIKFAIEQYEKLIKEGVEMKEPYVRLMLIYKKLGWIEDEKRIMELAINFFKEIKAKQKDYILTIATKYGMKEKVLEFINNGKKIWYYGGAFELYNPMPFIDEWEIKLEKIKY